MKYTHTSVPFSPRAITAGGQTSACVNLRAITLDGENTMTMAEAVSSLYDYPLIPLAHFPDSLCYLFRSKPDEQGTVQLFVFITGEALVYIGKVDGVPSCTVADGENLVLMLPDGPQTISRSGSVFTITGPKPEIPPISVTAVSKGTLTARTSPFTASLAISGQSALLAPDSLERLRTSLFSAYSALSLEANTGGLWIQPVAVRYRVLDCGGNELWRSPVSIVSLDGWQCISGIQAALSPDNGSYSVPALGLAAKAFALQVSVSPPDGSDPWYKRAATVVVEASPQVHPLLPDRAPVARISAATSSSPKLTVWLPGVSPERDANVIMHSRLLQSIAFQPDTAGNVLAMSLSDGQMHHLLVPECIEHLGAAGSNVWLTGTDSTFALGTPGDAVRQHIEWCGSVFLPVAVRPVQLTVPVAASHFDGTVELRADNGAGTAHSLLVAKLEINGEINAPLRLRVVSPPRSRLTLRIIGRASADFLLRTAYVGAISTRSLR